MPRNRTLLSLLQSYRADARLSGNAAHNAQAREGQVLKIQLTQEWLWEKHAWPHLRVQRYLDLAAGQRYYSMPGDDLSIDRLETIEVRYGQEWITLCTGIGPEQYSAYDSDLDVRSWPAERWAIYEDDQLEIWPVPSDNANTTTLEGRMRLTGIRNLRPLVADSDRCDLDDMLIVHHAAAEYLAGSGSKDSQLVLDKAKDLEVRLTGSLAKKRRFSLGGSKGGTRRVAQLPRVHYRTGS